MTTKIDDDGIDLQAQDLSTVSTDGSDHGRIFYHDGSSAITLASGSTTSKTGHYSWDNNKSGWFPVGMGEDPEYQTLDTEKTTVDNIADDDHAITVQPSSARQRHTVFSSEIEESGAGSADYNLIKFDDDFGTTSVDHIVKWGYNIAPDNTREDTSEAQHVHSIESKFENSDGDIATEQHWEGQYPDGTNFRSVSATVQYSPSKQETTFLAGDEIQFKQPSRDGGAIQIKIDVPNTQIDAGDYDLINLGGTLQPEFRFLNIKSSGQGGDGLALRDESANHNFIQMSEDGPYFFNEPGGNKVVNMEGTGTLWRFNDAAAYAQKAADPGTGELRSGESCLYTSDGSADATGAAGDLVYAINDGGTIKTSVVAAVSNAT